MFRKYIHNQISITVAIIDMYNLKTNSKTYSNLLSPLLSKLLAAKSELGLGILCAGLPEITI
jgi:hypothetical protein